MRYTPMQLRARARQAGFDEPAVADTISFQTSVRRLRFRDAPKRKNPGQRRRPGSLVGLAEGLRDASPPTYLEGLMDHIAVKPVAADMRGRYAQASRRGGMRAQRELPRANDDLM